MISRIIILASLVFLVSCAASTPYKEKNRTALAKITNQKQVTEVWHIQVGNGAGNTHRDLLPQTHSGITYINAVDGTVMALVSQSGKILWTTKLNQTLDSSVGVDDHQVFVATRLGAIYALDKTNGKVLWHSTLFGEISSAPVSNNQIVILRTASGNITALNAIDGKLLWQYQRPVLPFSLQGDSVPVFINNQVLMGTSNGDVISLEIQSGKVLWVEPVTFSYGRTIMDRIVDVDTPPVFNDNAIFVASMHGTLSKLDKITGNNLWSIPYSTAQPLSLNNDTIIASHEEGFFGAFSQKNGTKLWSNNQLIGYDLIGPAIFKNKIVVATRIDNYLFWLNNKTHEISYYSYASGSKIISLISTKDGILVYTKNGLLSLHH